MLCELDPLQCIALGWESARWGDSDPASAAVLLVRVFLLQRMFSSIFYWVIPLFVSIVLASAQAPSAPEKPLPHGPMQAKVKASCTSCHNTSRLFEQHMTRDQWSAELERMEGLGALIQDSDREAILNYLTKNFGPAKGAKGAAKKPGGGGD